MKTFARAVAFLVALLCMINGPFVFLSSAATADQTDDEARYTKKIVSVLYDNSGSMDWDNKNDYALYAIQALAALLDSDDVLTITPMNNEFGNPVSSASYSITVDLSSPNRNQQIADLVSEDLLVSPNGGTPGESIKYAIEMLKANGLMDQNNLANMQEDVEHWLVVLTDGVFGNEAADRVIERHISSYPTLKTIYLGLGPDAATISTSSSIARKYSFTPYRAEKKEEFLAAMRDIANQMSGRYTMDDSNYTVKSNTVTIDLSKSEFSLKSISVIAQDCDATLVSATYNGKSIAITAPCTIVPNKALKKLNVKAGCSGVMEGSPYFSGGTLVLTFSSAIDKNNLSILVEPALSIRTYLEYYNGSSWERTTAQYINANLTKKDKIRVGYDVYEQATNKIVDISKLFGDVESSVTYAKNSYKVGDPIPLVVGNNEVSVMVSVMDGAYKMYSSTICIIEENPTYYRVEAQHGSLIPTDTNPAPITYTVYANNSPLSASALSGDYTWSIKVTAPNGTETTVPGTVGSDGRIQAMISATSGLYGVYRVNFKVATKQGITREYACDLLYSPDTILVESNGPKNVSDSNPAAQISFSVRAGNQKLSKDTLSFYNWSVDVASSGGASVTVNPVVADTGDVVCDLDLTNQPYGTYRLTFTLNDGNGKTYTGEHLVTYTPGFLEVKGDHADQLPPGKTETEATYRVLVNGVQLTKAQLASYPTELVLISPDGTETEIPITVQADGTVHATIRVQTYSFGAYEVRFRVEVADGAVGEYTHTLKYYPSTVALQVLGNDSLTLTEYQLLDNSSSFRFELLLDNDPFLFDNGLFQYSLRVGGIDVMQYAEMNGNVLSYTPKADHFNGALSPGERNVVLELTCPDVPSLTASATTKLTVSASTYVIESVDLGNKCINRFRMKDVDAKLYFRVLCDGNALNVKDLQSIYDGGRIEVADTTGVFTWQVWAPCGIETSVAELNGEAFLQIAAVQTFDFLDSYPAMLIFCRESPIEVACDGAIATDSFEFTPSPWWAYVIRILAILLTIYILLWLWPFVVKLINLCVGYELLKDRCKSIPEGYLVNLSLAGTNASAYATEVNTTFWEKYGWHFGRLFLHGILVYGERRLWHHQPPVDAGGIEIHLSQNGDTNMIFTGGDYYPIRFIPKRGRGCDAFIAYRNELASSGTATLSGVYSRELLLTFSIAKNANRVPIDEPQSLDYYGLRSARDGKITTVKFFVPKT